MNISKLLYLFEKYWDKVVLVARRDSNHYANRFYLKEDETILDLYAKSKNSNKYGVINLQHKDTIEIRIFKGTLNYRTFIATLQFVDRIAKIIKDIDIYNIQELTWDKIAETFDQNLISYIEEREQAKKKEKQEKPKTTFSTINDLHTFVYNPGASAVFTREYINHWMSDTSIQSLQNAFTQEVVNIENMTIEQLKDKINELKRQINRSRNPMEIRELQREMSKYSNRLGELRRRSQRQRVRQN